VVEGLEREIRLAPSAGGPRVDVDCTIGVCGVVPVSADGRAALGIKCQSVICCCRGVWGNGRLQVPLMGRSGGWDPPGQATNS